ncbi:MAG TPA: VOC family protein [Candidatus Limnocylindrales bacterium]|nr:VOC family protein [Candidatus Limnocylindrales bacterium]
MRLNHWVALPMKIRGTDFVMFPVSDLARAAKFYREILGLPQEVYSEEGQWAEFNCGNVTLSLRGGEMLPEKVPGGHIALAVDDVQAASKELQRRGIRMAKEPQDYGCCQAVEILDPDGNRVILHRRADGTFGSTPSGS